MANPPINDDGSEHAALLLLSWWRGRKDMAAEMLRDGVRSRASLLIEARDEARREVIRWSAEAAKRAKGGGT